MLGPRAARVAPLLVTALLLTPIFIESHIWLCAEPTLGLPYPTAAALTFLAGLSHRRRPAGPPVSRAS
jgi:hypothetical protein